MMTNRRRNIGWMFMMIATFLNPLGYAELVAGIMKATGWDYWTTTHLLYVLAGLSFCVAFLFLKINPVKFLREKIKSLFKKKKVE